MVLSCQLAKARILDGQHDNLTGLVGFGICLSEVSDRLLAYATAQGQVHTQT